MSEKKSYLAQACSQGKFNGQLSTKSGPQTVPNKGLGSLDNARVGSKVGVMKK
jgi:hypothetical protein